MLIFDLKHIGNKLYEIRTKKLLSRLDVAEKAELSDRAYADIERGNANMRIETFLNICNALNITPNDVLIEEDTNVFSENEILDTLATCTEFERRTIMRILKVYLDSLNK